MPESDFFPRKEILVHVCQMNNDDGLSAGSSVTQTGEDSSKMYLCGGTYLYEEVTRDAAKAIKSRLDELYGDGILRDPCHIEMDYFYTDENMNTVELAYYVPDDANPDSGKLTIKYQCGDVFQYFDQVREERKKKESGQV